MLNRHCLSVAKLVERFHYLYIQLKTFPERANELKQCRDVRIFELSAARYHRIAKNVKNTKLANKCNMDTRVEVSVLCHVSIMSQIKTFFLLNSNVIYFNFGGVYMASFSPYPNDNTFLCFCLSIHFRLYKHE